MMVDDCLSVSKCGNKSVQSNTIINSFIESKKLTFGPKKCHQIHIGKTSEKCPQLKVHNSNMDKSNCEKYLGDYITSDGKIKVNIDNRIAKGYGMVSEIL